MYSYNNKSMNIKSYIELPKKLQNKRSFINPINLDDDYCLLYCLLIHKYGNVLRTKTNKQVKDRNRINHYKDKLDEIKLPDNITFPINIKNDIPIIQELNNIKINVYAYDPNEVIFKAPDVIYNDKTRNINVCDLLLLSEIDKKHFVYITDVARLYNYNGNNRKHLCRQCIVEFKTEQDLNNHKEACLNQKCDKCNKSNVNNHKCKIPIIKTNIKKTISNCKCSDKKNLNRISNKLTHIGNITYDNIVELLNNQNNKCYKCNDIVLTHLYVPFCLYKFSIDRIDNYKPHDIDNVKISCYFCNCKDHYSFDKKKKDKCFDTDCACYTL